MASSSGNVLWSLAAVLEVARWPEVVEWNSDEVTQRVEDGGIAKSGVVV